MSVYFLPLKITPGKEEEKQTWGSSRELPVTGSLSNMRQHVKKTLKKPTNKQKYPWNILYPKHELSEGKMKGWHLHLCLLVYNQGLSWLLEVLWSTSPQSMLCVFQKDHVCGFLGSLYEEVMERLLSLKPCEARSTALQPTWEFHLHAQKMVFIWCGENMTAILWFCRIS